MPASKAPKALCANLLRDGRVVYLTPSGGWSVHLVEAAIASTPEQEEDFVQKGKVAVKGNLVVDPQLVDVTGTGPDRAASAIRERIRATGPTVGPDDQRAAVR